MLVQPLLKSPHQEELVMKKNHVLLTLLISLGYSTSTTPFFEDWNLKFWEETDEKVVQIKKEMPQNGALIIENDKGNIVVKTWSHKEIQIDAYISGSEDAVKKTSINKNINGKTLIIETKYEKSDIRCAVDYEILVPETVEIRSLSTHKGNITVSGTRTGITARTEKGNITMDNISGPVRTCTDNGNITLNMQDITSNGNILALTDRGNITISMPRAIDADIELKTEKGKIKTDHRITTKSKTMAFNESTIPKLKQEVQGKIGKGGPALTCKTGKGHITLLES